MGFAPLPFLKSAIVSLIKNYFELVYKHPRNVFKRFLKDLSTGTRVMNDGIKWGCIYIWTMYIRTNTAFPRVNPQWQSILKIPYGTQNGGLIAIGKEN